MRDLFFGLADRLFEGLRGDEVLILSLHGEETDFVRLNHNRIRQAGHVQQATLRGILVRGQRHASLEYDLQQDAATDLRLLGRELEDLRSALDHLPDDPHLLYATEVRSSDSDDATSPPEAARLVAELIDAATGLDLVGILASGRLYRGFANSLGQRNWHASSSFNLDWSCFLARDKAVKAEYAGRVWSGDELRARMAGVREDLEVMGRPAVPLGPGTYPAFLAPAAVRELLEVLSWEGFGLKAHRSAETPLIRMVREGATLSPKVTLAEDRRAGIGAGFTRDGFPRAERVELIRAGVYRDCLVGPRSAREFGAAVTGGESPESLDLAPGDLPRERVLSELGPGLVINNLWYCNFSDPNECRITGMTRFACFWAEDGRVQAPVEVLRFDDSIYSLLGDALEDLTRERSLLLDSGTYGGRSTASWLLPGVLVRAMRFTL
jgi:predicted Zn-dependent protease